MTYTINGKEYTKRAINLRCAELMGITCHKSEKGGHAMIKDLSTPNLRWIRYVEYDPCNDWNDAGPIIEKCGDELMAIYHELYYLTKWESIISIHDCTKLIAACICLIELNE
jgi:hypothetical protein